MRFKLRSHGISALILLGGLLIGRSDGYADQTNVELLIDDSGSMAQRIEGKSKVAIAKEVLSGLVQDLPQNAQLAVRTYGRQKSYQARDCTDMELMTPFGPNTPSRVLPGVQALRPNGMTPIAASLQEAAKDFSGKEGQNNIIVLLSDGEEDCNGDPCAAAKTIHDAGIHLQVNVIGFHVGPKERMQLQCVAKAGGGKYYDAANAGELKVAASEVKERIEAAPAAPPTPSATPTYIKQGEPLYGDPIRGGDSYEKAVPLPVGKLFHLDHQQPKGAHDFFSVQVKGGQTIKVSIVAGPSNGSIGAIIANPKHEKLISADIDGPRRNYEFLQDVVDQQDGTYYIMIGSPYYPEEVDDTFRVDLIGNFDANSDRDAGSDENRALEVAAGSYPRNYMSDVDTMDVFKFKVDTGKTYTFKARPANSQATIQIQIVDGDGVDLGSGSSPNAGAVAKVENIKLAKSGSIYVKLSFYHYTAKGHYAFAFGEGDVDSPHPEPEK